MLNFVKPIPVYIRLFKNRVEITRLDTGRTVSENAVRSFSNDRLVLAHFDNAEQLIRETLDKLLNKKWFLREIFTVAIQQMEQLEGGLSQIEQRALEDLVEHAGAKEVTVIDHGRALTEKEVMRELENSS